MTSQEVASLDPAFGLSAEAPRYAAIYGGLVVIDYPSHKVRPYMAKSLTTPDGGATWILTIRPGIRFSDGTPFDAEAVKFNWDRVADPATKSIQATTVKQMASYEVTDPLTLTIKLVEPSTQFPVVMAEGITWIGSPTAMKAMGADFGSKPVGAGPFVVEKWTRTSELVLARNTTFFDKKLPYLDRIVIRPIVDESQAASTFTTGGADIIYSNSDLARQRLAGADDLVVVPQMGGTGIGMDITKAPFDDIRVRRAIVRAIDPAVVTKAGSPGGAVSHSLFPSTHPVYSKALDWPTPNLPAAQKLLDAYRADHGGAPLNVTYEFVDTPSLRTEAEAVQAQLNRLDGLHVEVQGLPTPQYLTKLQTKSMPFANWAITGAWVEPALYNQFFTGVSRNYFNYSSPKVDADLQQARTTPGYDAQLEAYQAASAQIVADLPIFITRHLTLYYGQSKSVQGLELTLLWSGTPDFSRIWKS